MRRVDEYFPSFFPFSFANRLEPIYQRRQLKPCSMDGLDKRIDGNLRRSPGKISRISFLMDPLAPSGESFQSVFSVFSRSEIIRSGIVSIFLISFDGQIYSISKHGRRSNVSALARDFQCIHLCRENFLILIFIQISSLWRKFSEIR